MDDALLVGEGAAFEDPCDESFDVRRRDALVLLESRPEVALAELEDEVGRVLVQVLLEDLDEAWPGEPSQDRALRAERGDELRADRDLDRDARASARGFGAEDAGEAATADLARDEVPREVDARLDHSRLDLGRAGARSPGRGSTTPFTRLAAPGVLLRAPGFKVAMPGFKVAGPGPRVATPGVSVVMPGLLIRMPGLSFAIPSL